MGGDEERVVVVKERHLLSKGNMHAISFFSLLLLQCNGLAL